MIKPSPVQLIDDFLGSVHILSSAVNELLAHRLQDVSGGGLTFSQLKLLNLIALTEGHTITDVAQFLGVSNAAASKAVDRLVRRNLLNRVEAEADRRAVVLSLTPQGRELLESYQREARGVLNEIFGRLSGDELKDATTMLDRLSLSIVDREEGVDEVCFRCGIHFRNRCLLRQSRQRDCFFHLHRKRAARIDSGDGSGDGVANG